MDPGPARDALTVLLGLATGVLSGVFGVGGGVISQPGMRLPGLGPLTAIGTALPTIIPSAVSGTARYVSEGLVDWRAVRLVVPLGLAASVGGSLLSDAVPGDGHLLQLVTAMLLAFSALRMVKAPRPRPADEAVGLADDSDPAGDPTATTAAPVRAAARLTAIGAVAGGLSGLLGIGGGVVMVPALVHLGRLEVKAAIATSLVCVGLFAVPGTVTHILLDHVDARVFVALALGVVPGARLGAQLAIRAPDHRLRVAVATFLLGVALVYAAGELVALAG